ncbi:NPCBM/NEW2 domain-containing protein [Hymenobacter sp. GOD-10R]|uniref:NPCBM/NEW2 domain-containing protein n=1 Tax=Hymenobacter sp. GOD-10R TaxID=3093922 RepID=UPI002D7943CF|nr:NPCBM/NEW2 domain-containing protein [Hymenobacter sp. GOD-10R]WRQ31882.1 NPCBM/NEW2 domain-containing protein [Hymenobacter sp. GOD-10R]
MLLTAVLAWLCLATPLIGWAWGATAVGLPNAEWETLGGPTYTGWQGLQVKKGEASLQLPGSASFQYPVGPKGWYTQGFRTEHDGTHDWRSFYGLEAEVWVPKGRTLELQATLLTPPAPLRQNYLPETHANLAINGGKGGWQHIILPWSTLDVPDRQVAMLKFAQRLRLTGKFTDNSPTTASIRLKNVRLILAPVVALRALVLGQAVQAGQKASYQVTLTNCTNQPQDITLRFARTGFEVMTPTVTPAQVQLAPGASAACVLSVMVPREGVPAGGHEQQCLRAVTSSGLGLPELTFVTARDVPRPSILHDAARWAAVRAKVQQYAWAKTEQEHYVKLADEWQVPNASLPPDNYSAAEKHTFVFPEQNFIQFLPATAYAWQLTREKKYAEKVALFLRRLADEKTGYPSTFAGTDKGGPQEGDNFQKVATAYDAILDADVLTATDRQAIDRTLRLFMETFEPELTVGNMGNWCTAQATACLMSALAMGDLAAAERYIHGPSGFTDYLSKGVMDDGWWWEVSTGYNLWVAYELTQAALACQPWGIDLVHLEVPADYSPYAMVMPWGLNPPYGVSFEKWGPQRRNTRSLKHFWDAIPPVADYRGVAFGMNDGHEEKVGGYRLELAYYVYHDPAYAAIIKLGGQRDLLYGVPELPAETPALYGRSAYAENIGYALLRSQTPNRTPREQIQAVLKIGTQGGFHGHFDRVSLDNLTRYGRSFWNPETIWWGYPNFMYKFYVQASVNHNMVVVDQQQQEAVPSRQLLFHAGKMMQVAAQETNARWSQEPYLGMRYFPGDSAADQMRKNRQSLPLVMDRAYGKLGPHTEPILQRRLAIVTDDYVVLADYLKGTQPHTFDNLLQMRSLQSLTAANKKFLRHDAQYSTDPHSAAQVITDVDWYTATAPAVARFKFDYGLEADNSGTREMLNETGPLKMDVHSLWPRQQELMVAMPPETHDNQQWVNYQVLGDGKTLASGESGIWILGQQEIDVSVKGLQELTLQVRTDGGKKKTLFWANARLIMADGREQPLTDLGKAQNVDVPVVANQDYYGGPIKVAGVRPTSALPTQPQDAKAPAIIRVPLAGQNAVRFKATLGGDFPFGDETPRRKVYASRSRGTEARFLTVLEPYENKAVVKCAEALSADKLRVTLTDGRAQEITIGNLAGDGQTVQVAITESKNGRVLRSETTAP